METIKTLEGEFGQVPGASAIRSRLSKVRRAMRGDDPDRDKAMGELNLALEVFASEAEWRKRASTELAPGLNTYNDALKGNIGVRLQERLTKTQATTVAACLSNHRDISMSF